MIKHRVINGAVMIALLIGALFLPPVGVFLIIPVLTGFMLWELYSLLSVAGLPNFKRTGTFAGVALVLGTGGALLSASTSFSGDTVEAMLLALIVLVVLGRQCFCRDEERHPLITISATLFGILYIAFLFNFYTKLLLHWPGDMGDGRVLLFYMILVVKVTDMAAYFTGCSLGRHKLIPRISPAKTWEGCAGGVAGGLLTSLLFWFLTNGEIGPIRFSVAHAVILGILLPGIGIIGDLIESMIKRAADVKDSGCVLKGMGGVLDVLDSLLFAAPAFYLYIRLVFAL